MYLIVLNQKAEKAEGSTRYWTSEYNWEDPFVYFDTFTREKGRKMTHQIPIGSIIEIIKMDKPFEDEVNAKIEE